MTSSSVDLLRKLASGVRPDGGAATSPKTPIEGLGFHELLQRVEGGAVSSGRPVRVGEGVNLSLSSDQLERLGVALDAAEAAGASRVLAVIDGHALSIDVNEREILDARGSGDAILRSDFDAFLNIPAGSAESLKALFGSGGAPASHAASPLEGLGVVRNDSILNLLASNQDRDADRDAA